MKRLAVVVALLVLTVPPSSAQEATALESVATETERLASQLDALLEALACDGCGVGWETDQIGVGAMRLVCTPEAILATDLVIDSSLVCRRPAHWEPFVCEPIVCEWKDWELADLEQAE